MDSPTLLRLLDQFAREVGQRLLDQGLKLALAESCTAGRAAAALGAIPGASRWFCGSFVVYRLDSKIAWLGVDPPRFDAPAEPDCVGFRTSEALARAVLEKTAEADIAAAITGHLGPDAPLDLDGISFLRIVARSRDSKVMDRSSHIQSRFRSAANPMELRALRQAEAAAGLLELVAGFLNDLRAET